MPSMTLKQFSKLIVYYCDLISHLEKVLIRLGKVENDLANIWGWWYVEAKRLKPPYHIIT